MSMPSKEYLIRFYPEQCIQCHGCETACKSWRQLPHDVRFRRVLNLWNGSFPLVTSKSLSLSCLHCTDPECAAACPVEAISKRHEDGLVLVDAELCIGCRACARACPYGVPQFGEDNFMRKCDQCFDQALAGAAIPCAATCPGKALELAEVTPEEKKASEKRMRELLAEG